MPPTTRRRDRIEAPPRVTGQGGGTSGLTRISGGHDVHQQASVDRSRQVPDTRSKRSAPSIVGELVKSTSLWPVTVGSRRSGDFGVAVN